MARLFVLLGLTGLAISQPLLDLLGGNPTILIFYDVVGWPLVPVALAIVIVPALVLWVLGTAVTAVNERAGQIFHWVTVGVLAALVVVQVLKWVVGLSQPVLLALLSGLAGVVFAIAYARLAVVQQWSRYTAVVPLLAFTLFVAFSDSAALLQVSPVASAWDGEKSETPVVFIVLDELPTKSLLDDAGQIDAIRFPNLAAFASESTWYRHHSTVAPFSDLAIPSILTGQEPRLVPPLWTEYPDNLFTLLAPTHDLVVFESFTKLCGMHTCNEGPPGTAVEKSPRFGALGETVVDLWIDRITPGAPTDSTTDQFAEAGAPAPDFAAEDDVAQRPARAEAFLHALDQGERPALYFLHLVLPHAPFHVYPDGTAYDRLRPTIVPAEGSVMANGNQWWLLAVGQQRHLFQARYTDQIVGELMAELKAKGIYDDAAIVVVADHGASFKPDQPFRHVTVDNLDGIAYAPFFFKAPGQTEGRIDDSNVLTIDVLPTLASELGVTIQWSIDGAPAGSDDVRERGTRKHILDLGGRFGMPTFRGVIEFDDGERFPAAGDRYVRSAHPEDVPLAALLDSIGVSPHLGSDLGGAAPQLDWVEAVVDDLGGILTPRSAPAWVTGRLTEPIPGGVVLVELNGQVVTGSPVFTAGDDEEPQYFFALLPPSALRSDNELRMALLVDGDLAELPVRSA